MTTTPTAIRATDLRKTYGDTYAVDGVSFEVAEGEIFGYLGRNGSGKTTTVRMLTTLTRPTGGLRLSRRLRRRRVTDGRQAWAAMRRLPGRGRCDSVCRLAVALSELGSA